MLWFTDLSAADPWFALPVLSSLAFLATTEITGAEMAANPSASNIKWSMRALAVALVPLSYSLPSGVFIYWLTSNIFSVAQTLGAPLVGLFSPFVAYAPISKQRSNRQHCAE
jgi:YidC/Oxa1 family membrane protein insertase